MKKLIFIFSLAFLFLVFFPVQAEDYNDLYVEKVVLNPVSPAVGQICQVKIFVKNKGTRDILSNSGLSYVDYYIEDFIKTDENFPLSIKSVSPSEYLIYTFEGYFESDGSKNVFFEIDPGSHIIEKDKENNSIEKKVKIKPSGLVNLSVLSIKANKSKILLNEEVEITVRIKNTGATSLTQPTGLSRDEISYSFPGFRVESSEVENIPSLEDSFDPGDIYDYVYSGRFYRAGINNLCFKINKNDYLIETKKEDNEFCSDLKIFFDASERDAFEIYDTDIKIISPSSVEIIWKTTQKSDSKVEYRKSIHKGYLDTKKSSYSEKHLINLDNLEPGVKYVYRIISQNNNVIESSGFFEFTTPFFEKVSLSSEPEVDFLERDKPEIKWETDVIAQSYVFYKLKDEEDFKKKGSNSLVNNHKVSLGSLKSGTYDYYIISTSTKMKVAYTSEIKNFEIAKSEKELQEEALEQAKEEEKKQENLEQIKEGEEIKSKYEIVNKDLYKNLKGKIILRVEAHGEAYYVHPDNEEMYYLGRPADAFRIMREQGIGVSEKDYDAFLKNNNTAPERLSGKIILRVEAHGEAYYVNPLDLKMHYLGRPADAFQIMRELGLGVNEDNFESLAGNSSDLDISGKNAKISLKSISDFFKGIF